MKGFIFVLMLLTGCESGDIVASKPAPDDEPAYSEDALLIDFGEDGETRWFAVNDTVMGGVSNGVVTFEGASMVFEGAVSTDSNGGFTSVRSPQDTLDLSGYDRLVIRLKSEGQPFSMIMANNPYWFQNQYKLEFDLPDNEWHLIELPLSDFELYTFNDGYPSPTGVAMTRESRREILHLELMSKLFQAGDFRLEVDFIAFD